jgi:uracil-DNA glycosylase
MGTMKTIDEIKQELMTDPRNQDYTQRDIPPIFQADPQAKILIIGQAPEKK